jgi:branched-chain amino acid transport system ATP-binding protein
VNEVLKISGLSGGYNRLTVFRDVNLDLKLGSTLGILGCNGVGKTTLLKTIAGLLPSFGGRLEFRGSEISRVRAFERARKGLVLVPEGRQILATLTVGQNLELSRAADRLRGPEFAKRLNEVLNIFPRLRERLNQRGGSLSGGEQQMLAIGRALLLDPELLMLDEPTQGLAPIMLRQVLAALHVLKTRFPMIVVEQNRAFLEEIADVTTVMRGGTVEVQT